MRISERNSSFMGEFSVIDSRAQILQFRSHFVCRMLFELQTWRHSQAKSRNGDVRS